MKKILVIVLPFFLLAGYCFKAIYIDSVAQESFRINLTAGDNLGKLLVKIDEVPFLKKRNILKKLFQMKQGKVFAGSYFVPSGSSLIDVFHIISKGRQKPVRFTFSGAESLEDFIGQVTHKLNIDSKDILKLLQDENFLNELGFTIDNILVMFIPNTYEVYWTISAKEFLLKMAREYQVFWSIGERRRLAEKHKLSPIKVSILASIVQSETNKLEEASKIAGVYLNRLKKRIPLCSDPTIKKKLNDKSVRRILKSHLKMDFRDNTYKRLGVPQAPLCIPKKEYIDAVLNAEEHNFFYFCAREDFSGYHEFSVNFKDHIAKTVVYKQKLNKAKIFK